MDVLNQIKRLVLRGSLRFSEKAQTEMDLDAITADDVVESVVNARSITKTIRSQSTNRRFAGEKLYVIQSRNLEGTHIYTKGTIVREEDIDVFYIFVSAKRAPRQGR